MGRFVIKLFLFLLPVGAALTTVEVLLRRIPNDYSYKHAQLELLAPDLKVLVLGSSPSYDGVDPALLTQPAFNAANISQGYVHDHAILARYLHRMPKLEWVVLEAGYASFRSDPQQGKERWRAKNYAIYFGLWQFATRPEYMLELVNRPFQQQWTMILDHLRSGRDNRVCGESGVRLMQTRPGFDLDLDGLATAQRHTVPPPGAYADNYRLLDEMLTMAEKAGVKVYLYTPPAWPSYRNAMDPAQRDEAFAACKALAGAHANVVYHDYLTDTRFERSDLFNANHVNASGSAKLSAIMAADMRTAGSTRTGSLR